MSFFCICKCAHSYSHEACSTSVFYFQKFISGLWWQLGKTELTLSPTAGRRCSAGIFIRYPAEAPPSWPSVSLSIFFARIIRQLNSSTRDRPSFSWKGHAIIFWDRAMPSALIVMTLILAASHSALLSMKIPNRRSSFSKTQHPPWAGWSQSYVCMLSTKCTGN